MTDAFHKEQMEAYLYETGIEDNSGLKEDTDDFSFRSVVKYIVLGLTGGIFAYSAVFSCIYLLHDTVKSAEEMKRMYLFPFYGRIILKGKNVKPGLKKQGSQQDVYECSKVQTLNRIRLACKKQGIMRLCAVSDFLYDGQEQECLEQIALELNRWGIELSIVANAGIDTSVWDKLAETGSVLMMCRIGTTTHRMIDDAMKFYLENDIAVLGAAAFLRNE